MKKIYVGILVGAALISCSKSDWKELESFHELMAKIDHPMIDSGDLTPAKQ
jgi:hypothetical protein